MRKISPSLPFTFASEAAYEICVGFRAFGGPMVTTVTIPTFAIKDFAKLPSVLGIETRMIGKKDHLCGNEEVYYQPLVTMNHAMPAVAELDQYQGPGLGVRWTVHDKRSAFVGSFSR